VAYVWVVDPTNCTGEVYTRDTVERADGGRFRAGEIEIVVDKL
jgi:hypothetical protein